MTTTLHPLIILRISSSYAFLAPSALIDYVSNAPALLPLPVSTSPAVFSSALEFHNVLSLDDANLLALVPCPTLVLILVFLTSSDYEIEIANKDEDAVEYTKSGENEDVIWYKQIINNVCGLYGILYAVSNGAARDFIGKQCFLTPSTRSMLISF